MPWEPFKMQIGNAVEDMWHVYNLVRVGDMVTAKTFRKVTNITAAGGGSSERVVIKLTVQVEATEFDPIGSLIMCYAEKPSKCFLCYRSIMCAGGR